MSEDAQTERTRSGNAGRADVAVVGGGISGLATAHYLTAAGLTVRVIEKSSRTGGTIETHRLDDYLIDYGPNSALDTTPHLGDLFGRVGIGDTLIYANERAKNRYIVKDGRLNALPMGPGAFVRTPLFSARAKLRLLKEPFVSRGQDGGDESLAEFVERRLGREFLDYAINPFVSGVYAGLPEKLSVRSSFPKLFALEQHYGSLIKGAFKGAKERKRARKAGETSRASAKMFSFTGGMQTVVDALAAALGDRIQTGAAPVALEKDGDGYTLHVRSATGETPLACDAVVFAIPAYAYDGIEFGMDFPVADALARVPYPPVSVVFFGYRNDPSRVPLDGFGFLVPEKERRNILGTIWSSSLFPGRAPQGGAALTTFVGGSRQPQNSVDDDATVVDLVRNDLRDLLGISTPPDVATVRRWPLAIPQYNIGHADFVTSIERFESQQPGIYLSGNFRGGVSLSDCVKQAHAISERVVERLRRGVPV